MKLKSKMVSNVRREFGTAGSVCRWEFEKEFSENRII
jgi:hypothetical protein